MSGETSRGKDSAQGQQSYKSEIEPPEESPFTCPICLTWLKEPMLTSCGHRFCKICIESWLERESSCCPIDNIPLRKDKDIFPDNFTRREISNQKTECPNRHLGCNLELSLAEMESHIPECSFKVQESPIQCSFKPFGCTFDKTTYEELQEHNLESTQYHLTLLSLAYSSITLQNGIKSKTEEAKMWDAPSKSSQNGESSTTSPEKLHELIRAMYERLIVLEQRNNEQDITIRNLKREISELELKNSNIVEDALLQFCGGVYIWTIQDFNTKLTTMKKDNNKMFYSQGFFTSANGYRFCARVNLSPKNPEFLGILVHVMQSSHDNCLEWPFNGKISLTVCHPVNHYFNIKETMMTRPDLEAFQKPKGLMNPLGFGYTEYILVEELVNKGFIHQNIFTVKIEIHTV